MESLTSKVLQYQKTRAGLEELVSALAARVYRFPRRKLGWDEDACGDFYLFFHPRLVRLIDRFKDQGKPFESYLCAVLNWQLRNFARERKRGERSWNVSLRLEPGPGFSVDAAADEAASGNGASMDGATEWSGGMKHGDACERGARLIESVIRTNADRRNFLFFLMKCSPTLDSEKLLELAPLSGVAPQRVLRLAVGLKEMRVSRERRLEMLRDRRNRAFSQARLLETELASETDERRKEVIRALLAKAHRRMRTAMERMAKVGISPTNREIALALSVPKGTVDSGLYWLKRKLASVYDPDCTRSA